MPSGVWRAARSGSAGDSGQDALHGAHRRATSRSRSTNCAARASDPRRHRGRLLPQRDPRARSSTSWSRYRLPPPRAAGRRAPRRRTAGPRNRRPTDSAACVAARQEERRERPTVRAAVEPLVAASHPSLPRRLTPATPRRAEGRGRLSGVGNPMSRALHGVRSTDARHRHPHTSPASPSRSRIRPPAARFVILARRSVRRYWGPWRSLEHSSSQDPMSGYLR